jgi:hypothetical protein
VPHVTFLWRQEPVEQDGWTRTGVVIETPWQERHELWYRVRLPEGWSLSQSSDAFLLIPLYRAMRAGGRLQVDGEASPSLLANLEEFQAIMASWYRGRFRPVEIVAEREVEQPPGAEGALTAFSGGVDSSFTAYRHTHGLAGRQTQKLVAGVMAQGFDIPIGEDQGFAAAADKAEAMLATLGVPLVRMATNVQEVEHSWDTAIGTAVASALLLLQPNARAGLIPADLPYDKQPIRLWGSHPLVSRSLSSDAFRVVHDGGGYTRPAKLRELGNWPAALEHLRVCWRRAGGWERNCGRCGKCTRTILGFRAVGIPLPGCFADDVTDEEIRRAPRLSREQQIYTRMILDAAEEEGVQGSWLDEMRKAYWRSKQRDQVDLVAGHLRRRARAALPGRLGR